MADTLSDPSLAGLNILYRYCSLFDVISTCRIARPLLDARSGTNVVGLIPHFYDGTDRASFVVLRQCQCPLGLIPHFYADKA